MTVTSQQERTIDTPAHEGLKRSLTGRQLSMIGLGGAIGAGLFVGSGEAIAVAGPGVLVSFIVAGIIVIFIMWMLGELVAEDPQPGAFSVFAAKAFGAVTGGAVGVLYWFQLVVVIAAEATAAAAISSMWIPQVHQGVWAFGFLVVLTAVNLFGVRNYGRFEYWFAIIKVAAIVVFLIVGFAFLVGWFPDIQSPGFANWTENGGFVPGGLTGISAALLLVIFSFGGTEVVAIAAAESENPAKNIRKAVRSVMWRILVFYIGSVFVIISILPWNADGVADGPFVAVLQHLRIPGADVLMSILIVIALLSALNANLYGSSRMAYSLAERGFAPKQLLHIAGNAVPRRAVLASVAVGFITVVFNFIAADAVLPILLNLVGSTVLMVWLSVLASYYMLRVRGKGRDASGALNLRPAILTLSTAILLGAVFILALLTPGPREQLLATAGLSVAIFVVLLVSKRRGAAARQLES